MAVMDGNQGRQEEQRAQSLQRGPFVIPHCFIVASHTLSVAPPPVTIRLPSNENATELVQSASECTLSVRSSLPLCASHILTVSSWPSALAVTMRLLSGEKATETLFQCSRSVSNL